MQYCNASETLYFNVLDFFLRHAISKGCKQSVTASWHNTFIWCEFVTLDQNHSREDPDGLAVCHKSGWTSERAAQGMIQDLVLQHPKGGRGVWDSLVRITLCQQDPAPLLPAPMMIPALRN